MAGFAVVMTVLAWGFFSVVTAILLSIFLYVLAKRKANQEGKPYRRLRIASTLAPFLALLWLVASLLIHVQISNRLAHQDCGLSPDPYVTLPNGYILGSLNTYDGYFKAPGFETDVPVAGPGYVRSIVDLHFSDGYFTGTQFDFDTSSVRQFIFDTRTRSFKVIGDTNAPSKPFQSSDPSDMDALTAATTRANDAATPDSYWRLYEKYRRHWPNYVLTFLIVSGEGVIGFSLWKFWTAGEQDFVRLDIQ